MTDFAIRDFAIRTRGLTKFRGQRCVLDTVDLTLCSGQVTAILGPSGAGKSTLLRAIAGLEELDQGLIESPERHLTDGRVLVEPERRNVGLVFQDFSLFPHLTAFENVMFGLRRGPMAERKSRAMAMLDQVRLAARADDYPHTLSGGEQQRIALARALAPAPSTILLDEAFSGLDSTLRKELRDTALDAIRAQGAAALMVTHDAAEAMYMGDELALMIDGAIVQSGPPDQLYLNPVSAGAARLLGEVNEWVGDAVEGKLATPFGIIETELAGPCRLLARPEAVAITADDQGAHTIREAHVSGAAATITLEAPDGECWLVSASIEHSFAAGQKASASLNPLFCQIIPAD